MVDREFPNATLVAETSNLGFAGANNRGLSIASGEYIVLLNSDTILEDDTLARCIHWMHSQQTIGAATPLLVGVDDKQQMCQFRFMSIKSEILQMLWRVPVPPEIDNDPRCWLPGTALVIRRDALDDVGRYLDDSFFMYGEDADLSMRLHKAGWLRSVFRTGHIRHYGGASGGGADPHRRSDLQAWYFYARYQWARKHLSIVEFIVLWVIDTLDIVRVMLTSLWNGSVSERYRYSKTKMASLVRAINSSKPPKPRQVRTSNANIA